MSAAWGPVPRFFLVPFLLFWSFVTLLFDGVMGYRVARQFLTARYSSVPGTITRSEVTESPSTEGSTYRFEVRYTYEVNGREYMGTDASHSLADGYASSREPRTLARRFPVGVTVPVFYRPEAPEVSVLLKGTQASDLFFLMFMTPFNSVMLAGWYSVTKPLWRRTRRPDNPVGATFKEGRTHVPLTGTRSKIVIWLPGEQLNTLFKKDRRHALLAELSPVGAGLWAVASTSIVGCFVAMVPMEFELVPPMPLMMLVWSTVIATGLSVALWHRARRNAGAFDLIVDERRERISWPAPSSRAERLDLPWSRIQSITLEKEALQNRGGNVVWATWQPTITFTNDQGESESVRLAEWNDEKRATALVSWLRQQVGLERRGSSVPPR